MIKPLGVQLYSVREYAKEDFVKVLKKTAEIGYKVVEPAGFFDLTPAEFKKIIEMLPDALEIEDVFTDPLTSVAFKGEGATVTLAKKHITVLKSYEQKHKNSFNIAEGI